MNSFLAKKAFTYALTSRHKRGNGIFSAFITDLVQKAFNDKDGYKDYSTIEKRRAELRNDKRLLEVEDLGAGSQVLDSDHRLVQNIAISSLSPKKYAQLLYRIVRYFRPKIILEMGTSLGISGAYMAKARDNARFITLEGSQAIADIAQETFDACKVTNAEIHVGNFDDTLQPILDEVGTVDIAFIDGNHQKEATLKYFEQLLPYCKENSILIFDDICWSSDMFEAWRKMKNDKRVRISVNLCKMGIIFFKRDGRKQDYTIRY
jgi:predicted O-methyltransferase YrrM